MEENTKRKCQQHNHHQLKWKWWRRLQTNNKNLEKSWERGNRNLTMSDNDVIWIFSRAWVFLFVSSSQFFSQIFLSFFGRWYPVFFVFTTNDNNDDNNNSESCLFEWFGWLDWIRNQKFNQKSIRNNMVFCVCLCVVFWKCSNQKYYHHPDYLLPNARCPWYQKFLLIFSVLIIKEIFFLC